MRVPVELGRLAREHNHEAMAYMKQALKHHIESRKFVTAALKLPIPDEVRDLLLSSLEEGDEGIMAMADAAYHQREVEGIAALNAQRRDPYKKGNDE